MKSHFPLKAFMPFEYMREIIERTTDREKHFSPVLGQVPTEAIVEATVAQSCFECFFIHRLIALKRLGLWK